MFSLKIPMFSMNVPYFVKTFVDKIGQSLTFAKVQIFKNQLADLKEREANNKYDMKIPKSFCF